MTTKEAAHYVRDAGRFTGATITAHHLLYNRNAIFAGGIRRPCPKRCLSVSRRSSRCAAAKRSRGSWADQFVRTREPLSLEFAIAQAKSHIGAHGAA